jgi:hypothetical protein
MANCTLIYRRWSPLPNGAVERIDTAVEGRGDVSEFYNSRDGWIEIRYTNESGKGNYMVPMGQVLAFYWPDDDPEPVTRAGMEIR